MRHGPELHDALKKSQSADHKSSVMASNGDAQFANTRQSRSVHAPEYAGYGSVHGGFELGNGPVVTTAYSARESATVEQQAPPGVSMLQQHSVISDSGYWSPKNYNSSDYHVPVTKPLDLQRNVSSAVGARPMMPPPPPPPLSSESKQRDRLAQNSEYSAPPNVSTVSSATNQDNLPTQPPAPPPPLELQQYRGMPAAKHEPRPYSECDLPLPPMPLSLNDLPPRPSSPDLPAVPDSQQRWSPLQTEVEMPVDMVESPLPLPPEDVDVMVVPPPPPPPPLVESAPTTAKLDSNADDRLERLQPDSASQSSEASSLVAKSAVEEAREAPVRDHRSDLLDAIRKGQRVPSFYLQTIQ